MQHRSGLSWGAWLALLPQLVALIAEVVAALKDGKVDERELTTLGRKLAELVAHALA